MGTLFQSRTHHEGGALRSEPPLHKNSDYPHDQPLRIRERQFRVDCEAENISQLKFAQGLCFRDPELNGINLHESFVGMIRFETPRIVETFATTCRVARLDSDFRTSLRF